jgi:hypothetical protein
MHLASRQFVAGNGAGGEQTFTGEEKIWLADKDHNSSGFAGSWN